MREKFCKQWFLSPKKAETREEKNKKRKTQNTKRRRNNSYRNRTYIYHENDNKANVLPKCFLRRFWNYKTKQIFTYLTLGPHLYRIQSNPIIHLQSWLHRHWTRNININSSNLATQVPTQIHFFQVTSSH